MKKKVVLLCCLLNSLLLSAAIDSLELNTKIKNVTVFFSGAEVQREGQLNLAKGKHILIVDKLPQELSPQSLQVEGIKGATILSVKHQDASLNAAKKSKEILEIEERIEQHEIQIRRIKSEMTVLKLEEKFLRDNSELGGKDKGVSTEELKTAAEYYSSRIKSIRNRIIDLNLEIDNINDRTTDIYRQLNKKVYKNQQAYSQVLVAIECKQSISSTFKLSYYIPTAGWVPSYDFRVKEVDQPLSIVYNANVFQSSGEDWNKVNISLSSNNPSLSGYKPELRQWNISRAPSYLDDNRYNPAATEIPSYGGVSAVKGIVTDDEGQVVPFANVQLLKNGEIILGTTTDFDGKYVLKPVPSGRYNLQVSYVGFQTMNISSLYVKEDRIVDQPVAIRPQAMKLNEVMISENSELSFDADQTSITTTTTRNEIEKMSVRSVAGVYGRDKGRGTNVRGSRQGSSATFVDGVKISDMIDNILKTNTLSIEYDIKIPYTIPSDGKDYNLKIKEVSAEVDYEYFVVPKIETDAFLVAHLDNWENLNLISGKTSLYFKGKFTGESYINSEQAEDTLSISLGRDKGIFVSREENKEIDDRQFIGSNVKETIAWDMVIKNNKNVPVKITIEDQYPLSDRKSVEVNLLSAEGAKNDEKTGILSWQLELPALAKKELQFKYHVKYPKYMRLQTR